VNVMVREPSYEPGQNTETVRNCGNDVKVIGSPADTWKPGVLVETAFTVQGSAPEFGAKASIWLAFEFTVNPPWFAPFNWHTLSGEVTTTWVTTTTPAPGKDGGEESDANAAATAIATIKVTTRTTTPRMRAVDQVPDPGGVGSSIGR
jgi:hypothetical protein